MGRSSLAVAVGFIVIGLLSFGADALIYLAVPQAYNTNRILVSVPWTLVALASVAVVAIGGCYLTARLAPHSPLKHALVLGALGVLVQIAFAVQQWGQVPSWVPVCSILTAMPYAWIGGRIRERELARGSAHPAVVAA